MKVFYIAFACEPNRTSEPGVGWHISGEMAKRHEVTVLTRENNRRVVANYLKEHPEAPQNRIAFLYYDMPHWWCKFKKRIPYGAQIYQETWNRAVARRFEREIRAADVVHQITFGAAFFTPYAAKVSNHFVWGPLGGGDEPIPFRFTRHMGFRSVVMEFVYGLAARYAQRGNMWVNGYRNKCKAIIFRMNDFAKRMVLRPEQLKAVVPETAYEDEIGVCAFEKSKKPLRILMLGRLLPHKGVMLSLEAFASYLKSGGEGELVVCGSGILEQGMRRLMEKLDIAAHVRMMGQCPHDQVLEIIKGCDVMLHLSFREGGSWSILECMAHGLPIVCQRRSGMDDMVADDCGIKIDAAAPSELVSLAAEALVRYETDLTLRFFHGANAQARVGANYRWDKLTTQIETIYKKVASERSAG